MGRIVNQMFIMYILYDLYDLSKLYFFLTSLNKL